MQRRGNSTGMKALLLLWCCQHEFKGIGQIKGAQSPGVGLTRGKGQGANGERSAPAAA